MSSSRREAPRNLGSLEARIRNVAQEREQPFRRIQRAVASTVVAQMLPDGVVKGGIAMKIRVGEAGSRYTPDFDASRSRNVSVDDYIEQLRDCLDRGWSGFTGTVRVLEPRQVDDVPLYYLMQPLEIRLAYESRHWLTVEFELGHDEVGSTEERDLRIADDILEIFATIGLEGPSPIPLMVVEHQNAQKLHACTYVNPRTNRNDRAHDLVDLQILEQEESIDYGQLREIGIRLFAARRAHEWPPTVVEYDDWDTIYAEAAEGVDVRPTVTEAVAWANDLITRAH